MEANQRKEGYAIGEAARNKTTGQRMYVDASWNPEIKCVYYDPVKDTLEKVEVPYEDLERVKEEIRILKRSYRPTSPDL
ncbi:hypothetical protein [Leptospira borgpetersenii]|uniref:hypothetical protein n=1 Tax=Leptospira borgpetersenii TaxID=174 RepID=UPI0007734AF5|nr:hypothetical protein [Leptospira borgpetersenii]